MAFHNKFALNTLDKNMIFNYLHEIDPPESTGQGFIWIRRQMFQQIHFKYT